MVKKLVKMFYVLVSFVLIVQLSACGTIMYPERRGQVSGRIDIGVALLDGIGLLFFLIPGIIAYAVDFTTGTIYLPGTARSSLDIKDMKQVKFDPNHCTNATIEKIIREETGYTIKLNQDNVKIYKIKSIEEMMVRFANVLPEIENNRIALNIE